MVGSGQLASLEGGLKYALTIDGHISHSSRLRRAPSFNQVLNEALALFRGPMSAMELLAGLGLRCGEDVLKVAVLLDGDVPVVPQDRSRVPCVGGDWVSNLHPNSIRLLNDGKEI